MNFITYDEFKKTDLYNQFIKDNPDFGTIKIECFGAYKAMPIEGTQIVITKDIGNYRVVFFEGKTNSSGIIDNIVLPAPKEEKVASYFEQPKYTLYNLTAINDKFEQIKQFNIGMFGGTKVIQYIKMIPKLSEEGDISGN